MEEKWGGISKSIIELLQDSIAGPGISQQWIKTAKDFSEIKPDTEAAKELLEFLESEEVQVAHVRDVPE